MSVIIAVDGLSKTGKTTISRQLANRIGFTHISSGNLYRAVTKLIIQNNTINADIDDIEHLLNKSIFDFINNSGVYVNSFYWEKELRESIIDTHIIDLVQQPKIRAFVGSLIAKESLKSNCVIDGRDIGTILFPLAQIKFFFVKDYSQINLIKKLEQLNIDDLDLIDIEQRDIYDIKRKIAPLRKAPDSIPIYSYQYDLIDLLDVVEKHVIDNL